MADIGTAAAAVAGAVGSSVVFHPLDTILTLQQTSVSNKYIIPFPQYWRGVTVSALLTTPAFTVYLLSYRQAKKELSSQYGSDSAITYGLSGIFAELTSSVLWTPMEVIKGRMQLISSPGMVSTTKTIAQIYKEEKIRGFFRGYWMSLAMYTPATICYWYTYENLKTYMRQRQKRKAALASSSSSPPPTQDLSALQYALASSVATIAGETITNFLDVVKTRQQLACSAEVRALRPDDSASVARVARNLIREVGVFRALFKGLHVRLLYALPTGVLSMVIVESIKPDIDTDEYGL
ncbi:mitochondrial carrier domain-containing protein [Myxozyma melibiosi]|uniref:Mitochondrial carrier domain-containing protein n=1 Tax=Myxozyma melibiosi TaxID=54550 RepID=A0ABR1FAJ1_9ASCO